MEVEISVGELVDKLTILSIKTKKINDPGKLKNIKKEYRILEEAMNLAGLTPNSEEYKQLERINLVLWDVEDALRIKEKNKNFDDEFIQLARKVYFTNDERARIKSAINKKFNSHLTEEKQYVDYR
ncbi:MAG: DUF6165 family protein [Calditrichaceae bacterium]